MFLKIIIERFDNLTINQILEIDANTNSFIHHFFIEYTGFTYKFQKEIYIIKRKFLLKLNLPEIPPYKRVYLKE